jgi:hypothetical protein
MLRRLSLPAPLLVAAALALAACSDLSGPTSPGSESGQTVTQVSYANARGLTLLLTDAPGDFKAAVVTISDVYLQGSGPNGRVSLLEDPVTVDLLTLQNSVATLVQGVEIQGSFTQLRAVITGGYIEVETAGGGSDIFATSPSYPGLPAGASVEGVLHTPSFEQTGLKIDLPGGKLDIGEGQTVVMLDFDVEDSFGHQAGRSGMWVMNPNIKATNVTFGGNVVAQLQLGQGVTLPQLGGQQLTLASFQAKLTPAGGGAAKTVTFSDANNDGVFEAMFKGLVPGQYALEVVIPTGIFGTFSVALPVTLTVQSNQTVTQAITLTGAALPGSIQATLTLGQNVTLPSVGTPPVAVTLGQFRAQLTPPGGGSPVLVTFTNANNDAIWEAGFTGLVPGAYSLTVLAPTGVTATFTSTVPVAIDLTSGEAETHAFTVATAVATP